LDCRVLDLRGDDVRVRAAAGEENARQTLVVCFASSAGKDHLAGLANQKPRYLLSEPSPPNRALVQPPSAPSMDSRTVRPETRPIAAITSGAIGVLALKYR
jgi:hypothetical protein